MRTNASPTFVGVPDIGDLTNLHTIALTKDTPILFVCEDSEANTYLAFLADKDEWLVAKITRESLRKLFNQKLSIKRCFTLAKKTIRIKKKEEKFSFEVIAQGNLPKNTLPREKTKLEAIDFVGLAMWPEIAKKKKSL